MLFPAGRDWPKRRTGLLFILVAGRCNVLGSQCSHCIEMVTLLQLKPSCTLRKGVCRVATKQVETRSF
jgi:hypothetical protein